MLKIKDKYDYRKEFIELIKTKTLSGRVGYGGFIDGEWEYCAIGHFAKDQQIGQKISAHYKIGNSELRELEAKLGITYSHRRFIEHANDMGDIPAILSLMENLP